MRISERDFKLLGTRNKAKVPTLTESQIQSQIMETLRYHGWFVVKIHQSLGSYKGIADLYAIKNGWSVWIEVKTPRGKLSSYQEQFWADIVNHGGEYIVARCVEDVKPLCALEGSN